jgi:serpin B
MRPVTIAMVASLGVWACSSTDATTPRAKQAAAPDAAPPAIPDARGPAVPDATPATFVRSERPRATDRLGEEARVEAGANNARFAFDLYGAVDETPGNLAFSPLSISLAFGMAYAGARGATEAEIRRVLHFGDQPATHSGLNALSRSVEASSAGFTASLSNALWVAPHIRPLPDYLDTLAVNYGAGVGVVDFADTALATDAINAWVRDQTHEKIPALLRAGDLPAGTTAVLTNAVQLSAKWSLPFQTAETTNGTFTHSDDTAAAVRMMRQLESFPYFEDDVLKAAALPYSSVGESRFEMLVVLPRDGLAALEKELTAERFLELTDGMTRTSLDLELPRFQLESRLDLKPVLKKLGLVTPFGGDADFGAMSEPPPGFIEKVIHQSTLAVTEDGTEGTAATAIVTRDAGASLETPRSLRFDRPFLFFIRHVQSGVLLFMGRVEDP